MKMLTPFNIRKRRRGLGVMTHHVKPLYSSNIELFCSILMLSNSFWSDTIKNYVDLM